MASTQTFFLLLFYVCLTYVIAFNIGGVEHMKTRLGNGLQKMRSRATLDAGDGDLYFTSVCAYTIYIYIYA